MLREEKKGRKGFGEVDFSNLDTDVCGNGDSDVSRICRDELTERRR